MTFYKIALKVAEYLGYFWKKFCNFFKNSWIWSHCRWPNRLEDKVCFLFFFRRFSGEADEVLRKLHFMVIICLCIRRQHQVRLANSIFHVVQLLVCSQRHHLLYILRRSSLQDLIFFNMFVRMSERYGFLFIYLK